MLAQVSQYYTRDLNSRDCETFRAPPIPRPEHRRRALRGVNSRHSRTGRQTRVGVPARAPRAALARTRCSWPETEWRPGHALRWLCRCRPTGPRRPPPGPRERTLRDRWQAPLSPARAAARAVCEKRRGRPRRSGGRGCPRAACPAYANNDCSTPRSAATNDASAPSSAPPSSCTSLSPGRRPPSPHPRFLG